MALSVAVVGLGRAGSQYGRPPDGIHRSHVGAALATKGIRVAAIFDTDLARQKNARETWPELDELFVGTNLDELPADYVDVIALCTPPVDRLALITTALTKRPRLLIVEKPLASSAAEGAEIMRCIDDAGVPVRVNFHRSFDSGYREIRAQHSGTPQKVIARYTGGLLSHSSHLVDLFLDWFGPVASVQCVGASYDGMDPSLTYCCRMEAGFDALVVGMGDLGYDQFECDFLFTDYRIELANGGVEKRRFAPISDLYYPGYRQLKEQDCKIKRVGGLKELYANVRDHLTQRTNLDGCDGERALLGIAVLEAARRSANHGGRREQPILLS